MKISVIVPVLNEEESIRALLEGLLKQSRPAEEIVITDGGSSDATPQIIAQYAEHHPEVRVLREAHALPGRGRNVAASSFSPAEVPPPLRNFGSHRRKLKPRSTSATRIV